MYIAIATTRLPKVLAVKQTFRRVAPFFDLTEDRYTFSTFETPSIVSETPTTIDELQRGARGRSLQLFSELSSKNVPVDYCIGLEGGLFSVSHAGYGATTFLQSWAFVTDGVHQSFGSSGAVPVPPAIGQLVMEHGRSLGDVIDGIAHRENVRSNEGTWGILTRDLVSRQNSFELAVLNAMAPFYNRALYRRLDPSYA